MPVRADPLVTSPATDEELAALRALLAGARRAQDIAATVGYDASIILRGMELREPSFVTRHIDPRRYEIWLPTDEGIKAAGNVPDIDRRP